MLMDLDRQSRDDSNPLGEDKKAKQQPPPPKRKQPADDDEEEVGKKRKKKEQPAAQPESPQQQEQQEQQQSEQEPPSATTNGDSGGGKVVARGRKPSTQGWEVGAGGENVVVKDRLPVKSIDGKLHLRTEAVPVAAEEEDEEEAEAGALGQGPAAEGEGAEENEEEASESDMEYGASDSDVSASEVLSRGRMSLASLGTAARGGPKEEMAGKCAWPCVFVCLLNVCMYTHGDVVPQRGSIARSGLTFAILILIIVITAIDRSYIQITDSAAAAGLSLRAFGGDMRALRRARLELKKVEIATLCEAVLEVGGGCT
jgi:hypothetical protein